MLVESQTRKESEKELNLRLGRELMATLITGLKILREAYPETEEEQISLPIKITALTDNLNNLLKRLSKLRGPLTTAVEISTESIEKTHEEDSVSLNRQTRIGLAYQNYEGNVHISWFLNGDGSDLITSTKIRVKDFIFLYNPHRSFGIDHIPIDPSQINRVIKGQEIPYTPVITSGEAHFSEIDRRFASLLHSMPLKTP